MVPSNEVLQIEASGRFGRRETLSGGRRDLSSRSDARSAFAPPDHDTGHRQRRDDEPHQRDQDPPGQASDPAGMQRKLHLHEDIGCGADPWQSLAERTAVLAVVVELGRADARGAMLVTGLEERDGIDPVRRAVIDRTDRRRPAPRLAVGGGARGDLSIGHLRFDRIVEMAVWPLLIGGRRIARYGLHQRREHLEIEIQRECRERDHEQQRPGPQAESAMDVEIDSIRAAGGLDLPGRRPASPEALAAARCRRGLLQPYATARRQRQVEADEAVDGPDHRDDAEEAHAPAIAAPEFGDVHRVMQLVEKRDEVLAADRPDCAPVASPQLGAGVRIQEHLVVVEGVALAGRRIDPGQHEEP